jgi:DNA damage-inducible protein 1
MRLLDTRFAGMAVGVGQSKILGRIHSAQFEIAGAFFPASITVLEDNKMELLFGLDMLKRNQCCIDLNNNKLTLNAGEVEIPFLGEGDIEKQMTPSLDRTISMTEEEKIAKLMEIGYTRDGAVNALRQYGGNVDAAASAFFGSTL